MTTKQERLAAMDWEHPDYEFLYHVLLYEVKPHNILDKRTHKEAHDQTVREAKVLRHVADEFYNELRQRYSSTGALEKMHELRETAK